MRMGGIVLLLVQSCCSCCPNGSLPLVFVPGNLEEESVAAGAVAANELSHHVHERASENHHICIFTTASVFTSFYFVYTVRCVD